MMRRIYIQPKQEGKGRIFSAQLLAYVKADMLWEGGQTNSKAIRPIFMVFAASEGEIRPFTANARMGRTMLCDRPKEQFELLRSAEYSFSTQRFSEGSVVTAYLPELFDLDPGMVDPRGASFVVLPPATLPLVEVDSVLKHLRLVEPGIKEEFALHVAHIAPLFMAYLDRRTRAPLLRDARFYAQVLLAFLRCGGACMSGNHSAYTSSKYHGYYFESEGLVNIGYLRGVCFRANHDTIERVLAEEVSVFFKVQKFLS